MGRTGKGGPSKHVKGSLADVQNKTVLAVVLVFASIRSMRLCALGVQPD
jgi:hypothetical protein